MMITCPFKHGLRKAFEDKKQEQKFIEEHKGDWIAAAADLQY
ncbi:hypothetical protein [Limosilactobacillus portuensis]